MMANGTVKVVGVVVVVVVVWEMEVGGDNSDTAAGGVVVNDQDWFTTPVMALLKKVNTVLTVSPGNILPFSLTQKKLDLSLERR